MTITVISQTTAERNEETRQLFESIRPLLDEGHTYRSALYEVGKISTPRAGYYAQAWFRELLEYGATQGYPYHMYKGRSGPK